MIKTCKVCGRQFRLNKGDTWMMCESCQSNRLNKKISNKLKSVYTWDLPDVLLAILLAVSIWSPAHAGVDFAYLGGISTALRDSTQQMIAGVQAKNRQQSEQAYERILQIMRDLPDSARNAELMAEYFAILERIRATGEATAEARERLAAITKPEGAHIVTRVEVVK